MKKFLIILTILALAMPVSAQAPKGDMKDDTDYCVILKQIENYRRRITECDEKGYYASCYDDLVAEIIKEYYSIYPEHNLEMYKNFTKAVYDAYGVVYCQNKFIWPAGTMCNNLTHGAGLDIVEKYILDLLHSVEENVKDFCQN